MAFIQSEYSVKTPGARRTVLRQGGLEFIEVPQSDILGKSLCHAWSASPIYLLARYFAGLRPLEPGGTEFEAAPQTQFFRELDCTFPMGQKQVHITLHNGQVSVESYPYINSSLTDKEDHHE